MRFLSFGNTLVHLVQRQSASQTFIARKFKFIIFECHGSRYVPRFLTKTKIQGILESCILYRLLMDVTYNLVDFHT